VDGVRQVQNGDIEGIVALQSACFPPPFPQELLWRPEHLVRHLEAFPLGQFVFVADGQVVGSASSLLVSEEVWCAHLSWEETTGGFFFTGHDPSGTTLYGADISVHPSFRGRGIARSLYKARFDLVRRLGLKRYGTTCRIPGWREWSVLDPPSNPLQETYCRQVVLGHHNDRVLTPLLRMGLEYVGVVYGNMEDEESGDAAAILEWTP
jgi:GNAT superfamily N-acetyltransferase